MCFILASFKINIYFKYMYKKVHVINDVFCMPKILTNNGTLA